MDNLKRWASTSQEENAMNNDHFHLWQHFIKKLKLGDISHERVLDFGCNQGGFLRLLYTQHPYNQAVGVDLAERSLEKAKELSPYLPALFFHSSKLGQYQEYFDRAFSHEVLYLLDNLYQHALDIKKSLKPNGIYHAAIGCHTDNPQWSRWYSIISEYSNIQVQNYSLDDYADAFFKAGFEVSAAPFQYDGFVPLKLGNPYFPKVTDSLAYHQSHKIIFTFRKRK